MNKNNKGFTIIELLIVIVIIGILVAITAVSYTGITNGANTASAQSNARAVKQFATACQAKTGSWPAVSGTAPATTLTCAQTTGLELPSGVAIVTFTAPATPTDANKAAAASTAIGAANQKTRIAYLSGEVWYWDSSANPAGAKLLN